MAGRTGRFIWYELMTTDTASAAAFYGAVTGWGSANSGVPGQSYTLFLNGASAMGGLMTLPNSARAMGAPPQWLGYVGVEDVDAATAEATRLGASVLAGPQDIPTVGRFSLVRDPQGAPLYLFTPLNPGMGELPRQDAPGGVGWHELRATDWAAAMDFYGALFGWTRGEALDMGPIGTYQIILADGQMIGGMFNRPPMIPVPHWMYYINTPDIDAASARLTSAGGTVLHGPDQVPGGNWVIQARDPQGAAFALVGPRPGR